jgi:hypothetical protein
MRWDTATAVSHMSRMSRLSPIRFRKYFQAMDGFLDTSPIGREVPYSSISAIIAVIDWNL